jgi:hypothetical protein
MGIYDPSKGVFLMKTSYILLGLLGVAAFILRERNLTIPSPTEQPISIINPNVVYSTIPQDSYRIETTDHWHSGVYQPYLTIINALTGKEVGAYTFGDITGGTWGKTILGRTYDEWRSYTPPAFNPETYAKNFDSGLGWSTSNTSTNFYPNPTPISGLTTAQTNLYTSQFGTTNWRSPYG